MTEIKPKVGDILYRYRDFVFEEEHFIELMEFEVTHITACGYWFLGGKNATAHYDRKRWLAFDRNNVFACQTKDDALNSFIVRKQDMIFHLGNKIEDAKIFLTTAGEMQND